MKKTLLFLLTVTIIALTLTACGEKSAKNSSTTAAKAPNTQAAFSPESDIGDSETDESDNSESESEGTDRHIYKTVRIIGDTYAMIPYISSILDNTLGYEDHLPTLTFHYNVDTGKAESAEFTTYFPADGLNTEDFINSAIDSLSEDNEFCSRLSNIRTEVKDSENVTALTFDIDISTYFTYFDQYINMFFVEGQQNIEGYKQDVYYSRVDNYYDPKPSCEDGKNYFYDQISGLRVEWED